MLRGNIQSEEHSLIYDTAIALTNCEWLLFFVFAGASLSYIGFPCGLSGGCICYNSEFIL